MAKKKRTAKAAKKGVISFRCTKELASSLDDHVLELRRLHPGGNWTRSSAALDIVAKKLLRGEA